jgi:NADH-quinone oxidoreductase subunit J
MAVLQVIIYAGAIVVLITFVVMLLNLGPEARGGPGLVTLIVAFGLGTLLIALLGRAGLTFEPPMTAEGLPATAARYGTAGSFARVLFTDYFYPFELVSLAIVAALAGAVILAKRNLED